MLYCKTISRQTVLGTERSRFSQLYPKEEASTGDKAGYQSQTLHQVEKPDKINVTLPYPLYRAYFVRTRQQFFA
jgi:hypothetical protein